MPKLKVDFNAAPLLAGHVHGTHEKTLIVLHETVSGDVRGIRDITAVVSYLASKDYGIHGMTDAEGYIAWAVGLGHAVFWQTGGVNEISIGIEQVSRVMLQAPTSKARLALWLARSEELRATAKLIACIWRAHPTIGRRYTDGSAPGVTSHWDVSQYYAASEGHTDCRPAHKGGYYPIRQVVAMARGYYAAGWRFR